MSYLLDANVLSEVVSTRPSERVRAWLRSVPGSRTFLSVVTIGEIAKGVALMPPGARRTRLDAWLNGELRRRFRGRLLDVDAHVARAWGALAAEAKRAGRPLSVIDGLLLGTAREHGLTLVTRDAGCRDRGVPVLDPWTE